ncbi:arylsulfatase [Croceivirga thetidis]|uniref:Arylsulfatase n=1 Tax=Croceivirga thetidis TaxID=2721623 RepID=A0ABX1GNM1_9FLAO|nr:arylsulfatase [Croceivirga thetidis]NKI30655.1 arylsulfatase [Croceivirga thetidis]
MSQGFQIFLFFLLALSFNVTIFSQEKRPNIIYFLADDLGYGETGTYGQEKIRTPNIDALAASGMKFTQHYSAAPVCAPARYMLLTGQHAGHAYIRGNDEWNERGDVWNYTAMFKDSSLEGQRPIPAETVTLAELLKTKGYITGIFGKWGLGAPQSKGDPNNQGFDEFYGYNCQRQAHNLYPSHLWHNQTKVVLNNKLIAPHQKWDSLSNPKGSGFFEQFIQKDYAPTLIHEKALSFINNHKEESFFLYYASPLPHLPLQAPSDLVDEYRIVFGEEEPYIGDKGYFPSEYPRATYAAMITHLDQQLGELVAKLKSLGLFENTLIIFSSDNGPTYTGGVDFDFFQSSKPFENGYGRTKGFVYEGGIRVPMIANWPSKIKAGTTTNHISAFYDVLPTICDVVNIETPDEIDGLSFLPTLLGNNQPEHEFLYWEFPSYNGQQAVRKGKWKGIRKNIFEGNLNLELYNLEEDEQEHTDVSEKFPEIIALMEEIMGQQHTQALNPKFHFKELGDN